ncbi:MAG: hypothetical protein GX892_07530 [Thermoanaerobacteraceae bacterium]|nr:hypothetical protein [Thermoanaerobacteraceae bacterium]
MKNVYAILKEQRQELEEFMSPLARGWETVLFKAVDILHNIERRGEAHTREIITFKLLPMIANEQYDDSLINQGIQAVRELTYEADNKELLEDLNKVQELLFAVKISMGGQRR